MNDLQRGSAVKSIANIVKTLQRKGIRLICLDVDLTAINVHTSGAMDIPFTKLNSELERVAMSFTTETISLIRASIKAGLYVACTSFGDDIYNEIDGSTETLTLGGIALIRPAANIRLGECIASKIAMYFLNPDWRNEDIEDTKQHYKGDQSWHISQAMKHFDIYIYI
jgi:hypothetical protein